MAKPRAGFTYVTHCDWDVVTIVGYEGDIPTPSAEPGYWIQEYFHNGHGTGYALSCHEDWVYVPEKIGRAHV